MTLKEFNSVLNIISWILALSCLVAPMQVYFYLIGPWATVFIIRQFLIHYE